MRSLAHPSRLAAASLLIALVAHARPAPLPTGFALQSVSVPSGAVWQINRPIDFVFSAPVDFTTVNANTIQIAQTTGAPAVGEFFLADPLTVTFQPACPSIGDLASAGLAPHSTYSIVVPDASSGGPTVSSTTGQALRQGVLIPFSTPNSNDPSVLFFDPVAGAPQPVIQTSALELEACRIELGGGASVYFQPAAIFDPALGALAPAGFQAPLNLYSDPRTRVEVVVQLNQPVGVAVDNFAPDRIRLEQELSPGNWQALSHDLVPAGNCLASGAVVRVRPEGVLPQGRRVRTVLSSSFSDIAGQTNVTDVVVGTFEVGFAFDPGTTTPGDGADELLDEFRFGAPSPGSLEDAGASFAVPPAEWGNGKLSAASTFEGTGGPGGSFDWEVAGNFILDTTFSVILNAQQTAQQVVVNGRVDVRNFTVKPNATLTIQGPNPCKILASGTVDIQGKIVINGSNNKGVTSLNTTSIPESGAAGQCGGGRGGTGSFLTTQSTPKGEDGYGAFNLPGQGGKGGETAYNPSDDDNQRRPGGGGGGALGANVLRPTAPSQGFLVANNDDCPDQTAIGLDAEKGFNGWPTAFGAISGAPQAQGGAAGVRPFFDSNAQNDFWGTMVTSLGQVIQGELLQPWAGAGGGAGGDACHTSSFPTTPFDPTGDEKGAGGGGGGGSLTLLALGPIQLGAAGRIEAKGGTGGGGENSLSGGLTRIGGGSGGGSGGHVVLESATRIDLSAVKSAAPSNGGIYALGGQGGAGANNLGGSPVNGVATAVQFDALPAGSYPVTIASPPVGPPCAMITAYGYGSNNTVGNASPANNANDAANVIVCAGGDGGPGIIQLHTPSLTDIVPPSSAGETIWKCVKPPPIGATSDNVNTPFAWNQMVPHFGRFSRAQSKWIALGAATVDPATAVPDPVTFLFGGTSTTGEVQQAPLSPILSGTIANSPTRPYVAADQRTLVFDASTLVDDVYARNPALLRRFLVKLAHAGTVHRFEVGSASFDAATGALFIVLAEGGLPLAPFAAGDPVEVRPRFLRVSTDGNLDALAATSAIRLEFQAAAASAGGEPVEPDGITSGSSWVGDLSALSTHTNAAGFRFVRFRATFDVQADGAPLSLTAPIPSLEFLRLPFRF